MGKYLVRRLLWVVVVLFFVSIITFLLAYAVPGDPAKSIAGVHATPEVLERIRAELGPRQAGLRAVLDLPDEPAAGRHGLLVRHPAPGRAIDHRTLPGDA